MLQINHPYLSRFRKGAIALALASTAAVSACSFGEPVTEEPVAEPDVAVEEPSGTVEESIETAEAYNVTLGELTGNVEDYLGQAVSVRGRNRLFASGRSTFWGAGSPRDQCQWRSLSAAHGG